MAGLFQPVSALRLLARAPAPARLTLRSLSTIQSMSSNVSRPVVSRSPYPASGYFGPSYLPFSAKSSNSFFTPSRFVSSSSPASAAAAASPSAAADATAASDIPKPEDVRTIPKSLPVWLLGCSALVFAIIVIGGLTRLTESGLSIVEWNPITGVRPLITDAEWDAEWEKYRLSPEGIIMNANITRAEFKKIFYMEWAHRIAGRTLGLVFVIPAIYYCTRYKLPRGLPTTLLALAGGIGFQGFLGWYMVASGLKDEIIENKEVPRVSQYRLAAHLSAALALYMGMFYTALTLRRDQKLAAQVKSGGAAAVDKLQAALSSPAVKKFRGLIGVLTVMAFTTIVSGAFVAGLDAGLVYNEFPKMGEGYMPPKEELLDPRYSKKEDKSDLWWRNMLENPVTAQFDHRVMAVLTFTGLIAQHVIARRPVLRLGANALPRSTQRWSAWTAAAALGQVTLGITTLLYLVPIPLAAAHQAGAVVVLSCLMGMAASMRRPTRAVQAMKQAVKQASQTQAQAKKV